MMICRRFTPFCKYAIFWDVIGLGEDLTLEVQNNFPKISAIKPTENNDFERSDSILQFSHILSRNELN